MGFQRLGIGCDHAGRTLKAMITEYLEVAEVPCSDFGVSGEVDRSVDYPDYAALLAENIVAGKIDGGIAICGTGLGMAIAANKVPGVRAACVWDEFSCRMSREHNDTNVLCLGARALNHHRAVELVKIWLQTPFGGDRHRTRLDKIDALERKWRRPS